jgi:hypothetical protein
MQKSGLIMLQYEREQLDSALKNLFPRFRGQSLKFNSPNIDDAATLVMQCIKDIAKHKMPPLEATSWVKVIKAAEVSSDMKLANNRLRDSADLKLSTTFDFTNHAADAGGSDSLDEDPYRKSSINLVFNYPLGSSKSDARKWKNYSVTQAKLAEVESYKATIATSHEQTLRLIRLLDRALKSQKQVNQLNNTNLKLARAKFNRAELPLVQLINDETTYLTGKISEIETKLLVVNTLLDYLKVFDKYDCAFNRII